MRSLLILMAIFISVSVRATDSVKTVFRSGDAGYHTFRIPAIIRAADNSLLAFAEGRLNGSGDFGTIHIVMRRSTNNGKTWSPIQVVAKAGNLQTGNPAPVVDRTDPAYPKGRIFLFYNTGNNHEYDVRKGNGLREVWYISSTDHGKSWSAPVNITTSVHRPLQPTINPAYAFQDDWRSYANTPGHAIQLENGKHRGRILVSANHSAGPPKADYTDYAAHAFYTDDHGKTFQLSPTISIPGSNESMAAELSQGKILMNSRNQKGDIRSRIVSLSSNGGTHWDSSYFDPQLPDPINQGSILTLGYTKGKAILAFCNAASKTRRDSLTLRISYDEGKTWSLSFLLDAAPLGISGDYTAYSDLIAMGNKSIGVLYERKGYKEIVFRKMKWRSNR